MDGSSWQRRSAYSQIFWQICAHKNPRGIIILCACKVAHVWLQTLRSAAKTETSVFVECWLKLMLINTGFCIVTVRICLIPRSFVVSSKSITCLFFIFLLYLFFFFVSSLQLDISQSKNWKRWFVSCCPSIRPLSIFPPSSWMSEETNLSWRSEPSAPSVKTELLFQDEKADPGLRILKRTEGRYLSFVTECDIIRCPRKDQVLAR